ncbi:Rqc2 family fibronectin-binding protein [Pseudoleptotrichia goodfellowii]|nr:NFACT RNA binding domain-containing protein [Pseudoleptotrichia goodfellowii]
MYESKKQKIMTYNRFSEYSENDFISFSSVNEGLNEYFKTTITSNVINEKKKVLLKYIDSQTKKFEKILKNINIDLNKNKNYDNYKKIGDILAANMHVLKQGMKEIKTFDFYNNNEITISLDPLLSPNDNLNFYYNKYNKGKRTITALEARFEDIRNEIKYYDEVKLFIEKETDFIGIEEIENELKFSNKNKIKLNKAKKRDLLSFEYKGFKIFVGRNNKENEEISFSKGGPTDIWFHVKDIPGSHVLLIKDNKNPDSDILNFAASLAGKYSKGSEGDKVTVDYCERKFVKKIRSSKPGNVTYSNFNSINIII